MRAQLTILQQLVRGLLIAIALVGVALTLGPDLTPVVDQKSFEQILNPDKTPAETYVLRSIDFDVHLTKDAEGHSLVRTTETIDAVFKPEYGSHGIVRYLLDDFDNHQVSPTIVSVKDADGNELSYETAPETDLNGRFTAVSIMGDAVLSGDVLYTITYEQREVTTQVLGENGTPVKDEFTWNSMGFWKQPAALATLRLSIDDDLEDAIIEQPLFVGVVAILGGSEPFTVEDDGSYTGSLEGTIASNAFIGSNVEFRPGTFTPSVLPVSYWISTWLPYVPIFFVVPLFIASLVVRFSRWRDAAGTGIIVAQYEPYPGINVVQSGSVVGRRNRAVAAQLVDFAIRGKLTVSDLPPGPANELGRAGHGYEFEFVSADGLDTEELQLLSTVFNGLLLPGEKVRLVNGAVQLRLNLRRATFGILRRSIALGLRRVPTGMARVVLVWGTIAAASLQWGFWRQAATSLVDIHRDLVPWVVVIATGLAIAAWFIAATAFPLTELGARVKEHLLGVREYIELAEADRLRFLQSVKGAQRDAKGTIELNERMLPYAVLFGQETSWTRDLAIGYKTTEAAFPAWTGN